MPKEDWLLCSARLANIQGERQKALDLYSELIPLTPRQTGWRVERARVLKDLGQVQEARMEALRCLALALENSEAEQLLKELSPRGR